MYFLTKLTPTLVSLLPLGVPFARFHHSVTKTVSTPTVQRVSPSPSSLLSCTTTPPTSVKAYIYGVVGWGLVCSNNQRLDPHFTPFFFRLVDDWRRKHRTKSISSYPLPLSLSAGKAGDTQGLRFDLLLFVHLFPSISGVLNLHSINNKQASTSVIQLFFCPSSHALCCYAQCLMDVCVCTGRISLLLVGYCQGCTLT